MAALNVANRTLFIGDNLPVLRGINSESVDLIATDPPFNKGVKAFEGITKAGENISYSDVWSWSDVQAEWTNTILGEHPALYSVIQAANSAAGDDMGAFLCWLAVRVLECHRILKPTGSMYLHIDHTAHAYAKAMMDAIFGRKQFRNELVWHYRSGALTGAQKVYPRKHDTLLFYTKGDTWTFNAPREDDISEQMRSRWGRYVEADGQTILFGSIKHEKVEAERSRQRILKALHREPVDSDIAFKLQGSLIRSVWIDIPEIRNNPRYSESTGYPTQKPLALYGRMIEASTNPDDIVLDPFAGCATTCVAAERLGRKWVGIDINKEATGVIRDRLQSEVSKSMAWKTLVKTPKKQPKRTDGGNPAAPELRIVSRTRNARRWSVKEVRETLLGENGQRCQGCGWEPPYPDYLQIDHKKPRSLGGADEMDNYTLLCDPCNRLKSNKLTLNELRDVRVEEGRVDAVWWAEERWR